MKKVLAASTLLAFVVPAVAHATPGRPWCGRLYTVHGTELTAQRIYAGTGTVTSAQTRELGYREMCLRNPRHQAYMRAYDRKLAAAHAARVNAQQTPDVASWYDDTGSTACGFHATYGVANRTVACGTPVTICYPLGSSNCVQATVDDRGPYVGGRDWDLNQNVAGALGFSGVDTIGYRMG